MAEYFKRTFSVLSTQILTLPLTIVSGIIIARILGPDGKGSLAMIMLIAITLKLLGGFGIEFANVYFVSKKRDRIHEIFFNNLFIWVFSSIILILLALQLKNFVLFKFLPDFDPTLFNFAVLIFPFALWSGFALTLFQGLEKFKEFNLLKIAEPLMKLVSIILLLVVLNSGINGGASAILLSYLISSLCSFLLIKKYIKLKPTMNKGLLKDSVKYGLKGQVGIFFQFFNYRLDMFLVYYFLDISTVGFYSVSVMIAELLWYIPNAISLTLFPKVSQQDRVSANEFTSKISKNSISVMLIGAIILGLLSRFLIPFFYGQRFSPSIFPLQILLFGIIALGLVKIFANHLHGMGKPHYGSIATICSFITTIVFDFLLIPRMGIIGAALATTIAYIISLIVILYFFVKESGLKLTQFLIPSFEFFVFVSRKLKKIRS